MFWYCVFVLCSRICRVDLFTPCCIRTYSADYVRIPQTPESSYARHSRTQGSGAREPVTPPSLRQCHTTSNTGIYIYTLSLIYLITCIQW